MTDDEAPEVAEPAMVHARGWAGVALSMITTPDGTVSLDGRSGPLGCQTDRDVLRALRSSADWVVVGAATVRAEGYGAPSNPNLRVAVVSRSGSVDTSSALFTSGAGVLVLPEAAPESLVPAIRASHPDDPGSVDLAGALRQMGPGRVLAEGGPSVAGQLLALDVVETMFVTFAPFAGAGGESLARFEAPVAPHQFAMRWLYRHDDWLFARYDRLSSP